MSPSKKFCSVETRGGGEIHATLFVTNLMLRQDLGSNNFELKSLESKTSLRI
jgi:hypothetical protein